MAIAPASSTSQSPGALVSPLLLAAAGGASLLLRQLFDADTGTFTYLLADGGTGEGVLIDPVFEQHNHDLALIRELVIELVASLDTHAHADHVTGSWLMQQATGCAIGLAAAVRAENVTHPLAHGDRIPLAAGSWKCAPPPATPMAASPLCSTTSRRPSPATPCWCRAAAAVTSSRAMPTPSIARSQSKSSPYRTAACSTPATAMSAER